MIVKTQVAHCDHPACRSFYNMDPTYPQPYHLLRTFGWTINHDTPTPQTFCPNHPSNTY